MKTLHEASSPQPIEYAPTGAGSGYEFTASLEDAGIAPQPTESVELQSIEEIDDSVIDSHEPSTIIEIDEINDDQSELDGYIPVSVVRKTIDSIHAGMNEGQSRLAKSKEREEKIEASNRAIDAATTTDIIARYQGETYDNFERRVKRIKEEKKAAAAAQISEELKSATKEKSKEDAEVSVFKSAPASKKSTTSTNSVETVVIEDTSDDVSEDTDLKLPTPPREASEPANATDSTSNKEADEATVDNKSAAWAAPTGPGWEAQKQAAAANKPADQSDSQADVITMPLPPARRQPATHADGLKLPHPDDFKGTFEKEVNAFWKQPSDEIGHQIDTALDEVTSSDEFKKLVSSHINEGSTVGVFRDAIHDLVRSYDKTAHNNFKFKYFDTSQVVESLLARAQEDINIFSSAPKNTAELEDRRRAQTLKDYKSAVAGPGTKEKQHTFKKADLKLVGKRALAGTDEDSEKMLKAWEDQSGKSLSDDEKGNWKIANSRDAVESMLLREIILDNKNKRLFSKDKLLTIKQLATLSDFIIDRYFNGQGKKEDKQKKITV